MYFDRYDYDDDDDDDNDPGGVDDDSLELFVSLSVSV